MKPLIPPGLLYLDNEMEDYLRSPEWLNRRRGEKPRVVSISDGRPQKVVSIDRQPVREFYRRKPSAPVNFELFRKAVILAWAWITVLSVLLGVEVGGVKENDL